MAALLRTLNRVLKNEWGRAFLPVQRQRSGHRVSELREPFKARGTARRFFSTLLSEQPDLAAIWPPRLEASRPEVTTGGRLGPGWPLVIGLGLLLALGAGLPAQTTAQSIYVQKVLLAPRLQDALKTLGDRLETPGKERLTLSGTITRSTGTAQISVVWELPGLFRIQETSGSSVRVVAFDGTQLWTSAGAITTQDGELIETAVNALAEHFFVGQARGTAMRILGYYFRSDDGKAVPYTGPFHDIYEVFDRARATTETSKFRLYFINSQTRLLDQVLHRIQRSGRTVRVETRLSGWRVEQAQQVPAGIVRLEDGRAVLTLAFTSVTFSARLADGIFTKPAN